MFSAGANGDQGVNGTYYVNINSNTFFDTVIATSTQYAFEFDNVSFNPTNIGGGGQREYFVAGGCVAVWFSASWVGLFMRRRRKRAAGIHRLTGFSPISIGLVQSGESRELSRFFVKWSPMKNSDAGGVKGIDKSVLTVAAPRRYRNREHLRFVTRQACLICGRKPSDPLHLRYVQPRALAFPSRRGPPSRIAPFRRV